MPSAVWSPLYGQSVFMIAQLNFLNLEDIPYDPTHDALLSEAHKVILYIEKRRIMGQKGAGAQSPGQSPDLRSSPAVAVSPADSTGSSGGTPQLHPKRTNTPSPSLSQLEPPMLTVGGAAPRTDPPVGAAVQPVAAPVQAPAQPQPQPQPPPAQSSGDDKVLELLMRTCSQRAHWQLPW